MKISTKPAEALIILQGEAHEGTGAEMARLEREFGPGPVRIDCSGLTSFNSSGLSEWNGFMQRFAAGRDITFFDCSIATVEAAITFPMIVEPGRIESMQLPFHCESCNKPFTATCDTAKLVAAGTGIPPMKCPRCGDDGQTEVEREDLEHLLALR